VNYCLQRTFQAKYPYQKPLAFTAHKTNRIAAGRQTNCREIMKTMRNGPLIAFALLITAAISIAYFTSGRRPAGDAPPGSQEAMEQEQKDKEKEAAAHQPPPSTLPTDPSARLAEFNKYKQGAVQVTMEVEGKGTVGMELYPAAAPKTVAHFVDLCHKHFYDGIEFHRVVPGFVVQGGDPESKNLAPAEFDAKGIGQHGSGQNVPLEAKLPHVVNSIGLARSQSPDSGDSQFYFNLKDNGDLDGKYCVFGMVVKGQDIASGIKVGDKIKSMTSP